ncbi:Serine/threonine-protein phosphatase 7 long form [Glycine max]|nr:Serine/threonine-protein phosphatase 7 long form [Glycine max]
MIINVFFFLYKGFNMINSSSFNHHDVASEPLENDLLSLKIQQATPVYNHREAPPDEIILLLQVSGLYPIMKLTQLKRPETHTFHLKCGEATITLQDVSVRYLFELCHELLGVMPDDDAVDGNSLLVSWLASQFATIHDFTGNYDFALVGFL